MAKHRAHQFMTLADVLEAAKSETLRWTAARKALVVKAAREGRLTIADIERRFGVFVAELAGWSRNIDRDGVPALRATRLQIYEPQRRRKARPSERPELTNGPIL